MDRDIFETLLSDTGYKASEIEFALLLVTQALKKQPGFDVVALEGDMLEAAARFPEKDHWLLRFCCISGKRLECGALQRGGSGASAGARSESGLFRGVHNDPTCRP
jgi:hypothetical protein